MDDIIDNLVCIDEHGLLGTNYYWRKHDFFKIAKEELIAAGLVDERLRVSKDIIELLKEVDQELRPLGYRLYVSEGYRPKGLYELVHKKRTEQFGKEQTDRLINMKDMPHVAGKAVDVTLFDIAADSQMTLRDRADGEGALFLDYYKDSENQQGREYQRLQELVIRLMLKRGFRIGKLNEYFHFNYDPESKPNYPVGA